MKVESQIVLVDIENIIPNRFQPRLKFDVEGLNELAESIKEHGIIQPLVLRRVGEKYEIIAGERRYKASQMAGLTKVPAIIANLDDNESAEVAIIENTHRRDLSPIEEAKSYKKLLDRKYLSQEQLAKRLGKSQPSIANKIRLLTLDENVQKALMDEKISERHARSLLRVTDKKKQVDLLNKIISERWTVKKLDEEIDKVVSSYQNKNVDLSGKINPSALDIDIDDLKNNSIDIGENEVYEYNKQPDLTITPESSVFNSGFNFNPFTINKITNDEIADDIDIFDDEEYDTLEDEKITIESKKKMTSASDVIERIKDVLKEAKDNDILLNFEEFDFEKLYQIVVKIDK